MKTTPKDFFLHLAATIALYVSAIALLNLAFTAINYALPDALNNYFSASSMVWPISLLIVLIPLLYVIEWLIGRDIQAMNEKRQIWIRRWRIYLTLFLTGATIAGDLVVLINTYLNGEVTSRFIWKVLVVFVVCAVIFAYYILERMSDEGRGRGAQKTLSWVGLVLVVGTIVAGFLIVGSPAKQRALRFDETRLSDLQSISSDVASYWQRNQKLPATLSALNDNISDYSIATDPETNQPYEYSVTGDRSFRVCANFSASSAESQKQNNYAYPRQTGNWDHVAGHTCFDRTIDPTLYPPSIPLKSAVY